MTSSFYRTPTETRSRPQLAPTLALAQRDYEIAAVAAAAEGSCVTIGATDGVVRLSTTLFGTLWAPRNRNQ